MKRNQRVFRSTRCHLTSAKTERNEAVFTLNVNHQLSVNS